MYYQKRQSDLWSDCSDFLAGMVTVICFTTTAGLIVSTSEFFHSTFPKVSYKVYASVFTLIGFAIANLGLNAIIAFSLPVLMILYPITITIVLIVIVNKFSGSFKTRNATDSFSWPAWSLLRECSGKLPLKFHL